MDLHAPVVALGPLSVDSWTMLGRIPIAVALMAIATWIVPRAGWRRAALALLQKTDRSHKVVEFLPERRISFPAFPKSLLFLRGSIPVQ